MRNLKIAVAFACLLPSLALAEDLSRYAGYTVQASKYVAGYVDADGKSGNDFQGCEYGRKIVFDDQTYLVCTQYGYSYSYHPQATLLANGGQWLMIVNGNQYTMRNF
jgi:hypothetical protein